MTSSHSSQPHRPEEQLYDHLMHWVRVESPDHVLHRFHSLFVDPGNYSDPGIQQALYQMMAGDFAEGNFQAIFNRCCHILINYWHAQGSPQWSSELLAILNDFASEAYGTSAHRLHQLLQRYTQSDSYGQLKQSIENGSRARRVSKRLLDTAPQTTTQYSEETSNWHPFQTDHSETSQPLRTVAHNYPFLYEHYLVNTCNTDEQRVALQRQKVEIQQKFSSDLHKFYHSQASASEGGLSSLRSAASHNPTNLSDQQLRQALTDFTGRVHQGSTYRHAAKTFLQRSASAPSLRDFKQDFYEYLIVTIGEPYGNGRFHEKLHDHLRKSHAHHDAQKPNNVLLPKICQDAFRFLVIDQSGSCKDAIFTFMDLHSNIGASRLIGLLLKIALLCKQAKVFLEKHISMLFEQQSKNLRRDVGWLEESLEYLKVAFSVHYDRPDFLTP